MRGLYQEPEGMRCVVESEGTLERVEAALWSNQAKPISMDVYISCDGGMEKAASMELPGSSFPVYDGIHSDMRSTTFVLDPPLRVLSGDTVAVLFRVESAVAPGTGGVSGIEMEDVNFDCEFTEYSQQVGLLGHEWDFKARLHLHP
jgi:hypothetical protein